MADTPYTRKIKGEPEIFSPEERWVILYWSTDMGRWIIAAQGTDPDTARQKRDHLRQAYGLQRVRYLKTVDG